LHYDILPFKFGKLAESVWGDILSVCMDRLKYTDRMCGELLALEWAPMLGTRTIKIE
jgi:hypothetical protein